MMLFRVFVGMSIDGFIGRPDKSPAWGKQFNPRSYGYDEFIQDIQVIIVGRTTFDQVLSFNRWPWERQRVEVLTSHPLPAVAPKGVSAWHGPLEELIERLNAEDLPQDVWVMGGPKMIRSFLALGALNRIEIILLPVLLGAGTPLFDSEMAPLALELKSHRAFPDSAVKLIYSPV